MNVGRTYNNMEMYEEAEAAYNKAKEYFPAVIPGNRNIDLLDSWGKEGAIFSIFVQENVHCGYSLEEPYRNTSNVHNNKIETRRDFQQCGMLTSLDSDELVQPSFNLRSSNLCSVSSLTLIEYSGF